MVQEPHSSITDTDYIKIGWVRLTVNDVVFFYFRD